METIQAQQSEYKPRAETRDATYSSPNSAHFIGDNSNETYPNLDQTYFTTYNYNKTKQLTVSYTWNQQHTSTNTLVYKMGVNDS